MRDYKDQKKGEKYMSMKRPAASLDSPTVPKLLEFLSAKLNDENGSLSPSKQRAVGSNPAWDAFKSL